MKVELDVHGNMTIYGQSFMEHYALRKWFDDWQAHKVCLSVSFQDGFSQREEKIKPDLPPHKEGG